MNKIENTNEDFDQDTYLEVAKNALIFAIIFILVTIALWGFVYLTLLERGIAQ